MVYLAMAYMIAHVSLNFAFNAHLGPISILAKDVKERLRLATRNIQFGMASQIVFSILVVEFMLNFFSRQSETWGYFYTVGILAIAQVFGYWFLFYQSRGYEKYDPNKKLETANKLSFGEMVMQVAGNPYLLLLMLADCFVNLGMFSLSTFAPYYFKYVVGDQGWMSKYLFILGTGTFLSAVIAPRVVNILGKKNTYLFAGVWGVIGYNILRIFGVNSPCVYAFIVFASVLGTGTSSAIRQAMYMDTAEFAFIIMLFYGLSDEKLAKYMEANARKRAKAAEAMA
jgi:Na+/melibiose symporter-like transporter